jgi:hypothetical protein
MRLITYALVPGLASAYIAPSIPISRTLRGWETIAMVSPRDSVSRITGMAEPSTEDWRYGTGRPPAATSGSMTRAGESSAVVSRTFATDGDWCHRAGGLPGQEQPRSALLRRAEAAAAAAQLAAEKAAAEAAAAEQAAAEKAAASAVAAAAAAEAVAAEEATAAAGEAAAEKVAAEEEAEVESALKEAKKVKMVAKKAKKAKKGRKKTKAMA